MMNSIEHTSMSPHWHGQINKMTANLIRHKDTDDNRVLSAEEFGAPKDVFAKIDRNGDGQADRKELNAAHPRARFNRMSTNLINAKDADGDRVLNPEELGVAEDVTDKVDLLGGGQADRKELNATYPRARLNRMTTNLINAKDTDGDRVLNLEELGVAEDVFTKIDQNGDGQADRVELNADAQMPQANHMTAAHHMAQVNHMTTNLIKDKDTDDDKVLSAEELGAPNDVFAKIDANGDGQADRAELNAAHQIARIYEDIGALQPDNDDEENENIEEENENIDVNV